MTRFDLAGRARAQYRLDVPSAPVTDKDREQAAERLQSLDSTIRARVRADLFAASTARVKPPIHSMWAAIDGRLWVRYGNERLGELPRAAVFDSGGRWQTDVVMPPDLEINEIGKDYLLGYRKDEDGFFHLLMFLVRS